MPLRIAAKPDFANGALQFANRTPARLKRLLLVLAVALVAAVAGPFGTLAISTLARVGFWLSLCLFNFALWEVWFAWLLKRGVHWRRILLFGSLALLLVLPFEVDLALRAFAGTGAADHLGIALGGAAVVGLWLLATALFPFRPTAMIERRAVARFPGTTVRLADVAALVAEDYYVRLHLADGTERLVLCRFADAVRAMSAIAGEQIGRGRWVADAHRGPAVYRDRRWYLRAGPSAWLPVSRSRQGVLRERGWLVRTG